LDKANDIQHGANAFRWAPPKRRSAVVPVFLPFHGCPTRCLFCAQHSQTGVKDVSLKNILPKFKMLLEERAAKHEDAPELAFYGGTFTAMPIGEQKLCLDFAAGLKERGLVSSFRCSTRPDCVDRAALARLKAAGCATLELGVQSFDDVALRACRRGYGGREALAACARVKEAGFALGVQLLPGLPGSSPEDFVNDVQIALSAAGADMLRFYPCLVLRGTELEAAWRDGKYMPMPLDICLETLADGWLKALKAGVPVIRMGLAPEKSLEAAIAAGPHHPALGTRVMARALYRAVESAARGGKLRSLQVPQNCRGYFWGHRGELRPAWAALGLTPDAVNFVQGETVSLC
jgi:histone acetyltransferase (RNA polymerase elongator complex component)